MHITVNGAGRIVQEGLTLLELLEADGEPIGHAVVEVNREHLRVRQYASCVLKEGDHVEFILPAIGG